MNKNEMTIAEIKAMYFAPDCLMVTPWPIYRYHYKGDRFYYYLTPEVQDYDPQDKPPVKFAVGCTTLTRKTIPADEFLTKWIAEMGYDAAIEYRDLRAKYGSLLHTLIATMLIKRVSNLDTYDEVVRNYCKINGVVTNQAAWVDDLKQDVLAFAQFVKDYNVKPLAIELSLVSPRLGVAGTLDILCEMDYTEKGYYGEVYASGAQKGQPKEGKRTRRVLAIVDNKSGRKSTGGVHNAAQLAVLKLLLKDNYPQYADSDIRLYNWHPKDWRTAPDYTLADQTNNFSDKAVGYIIGMYNELYPNVEDKKTLDMFGVVNLDAGEDEPLNFASTVIKAMVQQAINDGAYGQTQYDTDDTYFDVNQPEDGNSLP
jgi:hypothetical protein